MVRLTAILVAVLGACYLFPTEADDLALRHPLLLSGSKDLYQRVLTLPGAVLETSAAHSDQGKLLPVFSIFYVYGRQGEWIQVGSDLSHGSEGWLLGSLAQDWSIMLTMQYAPPGQRDRVVFFEHRQYLRDLVRSVDPGPLVRKHLSQADMGHSDPEIASVEPPESQGAQQREGKFYLIPIIDFEPTTFDNGQAGILLQVSFVNDAGPVPDSPDANRPAAAAQTLQDFRAAIVFVLDTTVSMKPFFERAAKSIENVVTELRGAGLDHKVTVGIVAYRSYTGEEPWKSGLGYTTKIIQPLDPKASLDQVVAAMRGLDEARMSSFGFDEDAFAGLWTSLTKLDWSPFEHSPKTIWLITDAGAIHGNSPKAQFAGVDIETIVEAANRQHISVYPLHIASAGAKKANDVESAKQQWRRLGTTGDLNADNYQVIDPGTPDNFDSFMTGFEQTWKPTFETWRAGKPIAKPAFLAADSQTEHYRKLVVNGLFNAQQRYLGIANQTGSKTVFNAWTVDRDLFNPNRRALQVSVFLTKDQLNQLAIAAQRFYDSGKSQKISSATMFRLLQTLSAQTQTDPERFKGDAQKVGDMGLMPEFLSRLPYKSDLLNLTERDWAQKTAIDQDDLLTHLAAKLRAYREMYADTGKWTDIGGQSVMPVPLEYMP